jgi:hypothetical protein
VSALVLAYVHRGCVHGLGLPHSLPAPRCWACSAKNVKSPNNNSLIAGALAGDRL